MGLFHDLETECLDHRGLRDCKLSRLTYRAWI